MATLEQIRRLTIEARALGFDIVKRDLVDIDEAQKAVAASGVQMAASEDKVTRSTLSVERQLQRLQSRIDPVFKATRELDSSMRLLDRALAQGSISEAEHARTLGLVQMQYERTAAAAKSRAIMEVNARKMIAPVTASMPVTVAPAFQTANMAAQLQDTVVSAFNGMPAMTVGLQQGMQMATIVSTMEKPLLGIGAALASLMSPVSLMTIGLTAAAAAALQYFSAWNTGADSLEDDLKTQADLVSEIAKRFKGAGDAAQEYARDSAPVLVAKGEETVDSLRAKLLKQAQELQGRLSVEVGPNTWAPENETGLKKVFDDFSASIKANEPQARAFQNRLSSFRSSGIEDIRLIVDEWIKLTDEMVETEGALDRMSGTLSNMSPQMQAIADRWRGKENDRYWPKTGAEGMPATPSVLPAPDPRRSMDFGADEFIAASKAVADAQRALNNVGLSGLPATLAQINQRYEEMSRKAGVTTDTLTLLRQAQELERETAIRSATVQPLHDAKMRSEAQARALEVQAAAFGQNAETVGYLNEKLSLYNEYLARGVDITPNLTAAIEEQSRAAGRNAAMQDRMNKAQAEAIQRMDGFRSATKSALGSLIDGDWSGALSSFRDFFLDQFTSQLTQGLLGRNGEAGGGLFGDTVMSFLGGGATRGASASNPVYVAFGDGMISSLLGGAAKDGGLLSGGLSLRAANTNALGVVSSPSLASDVAASVWSYFSDKGLKPHQVAGIMGNLSAESSFNPNAINPTSGAFGLPQWLGSRKTGVLGYGTDLGSQLDYMWSEFMGTERRAFGKLMASTDVRGATAAMAGFERAEGFTWSNPEGIALWDRRLADASASLKRFGDAAGNATDTLGRVNASAPGGAVGAYPASLPLLPSQAAMMPAGVSPYGTGWAQQQLTGLSGVFQQLTTGLGGMVDSFLPGFGSILTMLLNGMGSGGGSGLGGLLGGLFGGGWGLSGQAAAFGLYADGGVPPGGISAYRNTIVSRPTLFAFANGAGIMGEAGEEGILPLRRNGRGQLGVYATVGPAEGGGGTVSLTIGDVHVSVPEGTDPAHAAQIGASVRQELTRIVDSRMKDQLRAGGLLSRSALR